MGKVDDACESGVSGLDVGLHVWRMTVCMEVHLEDGMTFSERFCGVMNH